MLREVYFYRICRFCVACIYFVLQECNVPVARGVPRHHFPLIAYHDAHVWPPRDGYSIRIIQHSLQTRPQPQPHYFPPEINYPASTSSPAIVNPTQTLHPLEAHSRKRVHEEACNASVGEDQLQDKSPCPPPHKKHKNTNQRRVSYKSVRNDSSISNDMELISSDEFDSDTQNEGVSDRHRYNEKDRRGSHDRQLSQTHPHSSKTHRHLELNTRGKHGQYGNMDVSFSTSPFVNMHGRQVHSHPDGSSSSFVLHANDRPFPRTPHSYEDPPRLSVHDDYRQRSFDHHSSSSSQHHHSMDYSNNERRRWRDQPRENRLPSLPSLTSPPQTPPLSPLSPPFIESGPPLRSHSGGFQQPHPPPAYHRHLSEPASHRNLPNSKDLTPASRRDYRQDRRYTTSDRGFRISNQRAAEIQYNRFSRQPNNSDHGRRFNSEYNRY